MSRLPVDVDALTVTTACEESAVDVLSTTKLCKSGFLAASAARRAAESTKLASAGNGGAATSTELQAPDASPARKALGYERTAASRVYCRPLRVVPKMGGTTTT